MTTLRPIDLHAHIEAGISSADLMGLGALVFAATRTLDEAEVALRRSDDWTIWGVGCHPGLVGAQKAFDAARFAGLIEGTAYVSEVGLDGSSRVPMSRQRATLEEVLVALQTRPRLTSLHSYGATDELLEALESRPIKGAVLHWWLGDSGQTQRAVDLGCHFSVNGSSVGRSDILAMIPRGRVLPETDHPFGDRRGGPGRRPGGVVNVERALARHYGIAERAMRIQTWRNLRDVVSATGTGALLPRAVRIALASA